MWKIDCIADDLIEVIYEPDGESFGATAWRAYKNLLLEKLNTAEQKLYILSNFTAVTTIDPNITKEFGSAEHLFHEKLGMIVIMAETDSPFHKFWVKIMELKGMASEYQGKLRADFSRERGLQRLRDARENAQHQTD